MLKCSYSINGFELPYAVSPPVELVIQCSCHRGTGTRNICTCDRRPDCSVWQRPRWACPLNMGRGVLSEFNKCRWVGERWQTNLFIRARAWRCKDKGRVAHTQVSSEHLRAPKVSSLGQEKEFVAVLMWWRGRFFQGPKLSVTVGTT